MRRPMSRLIEKMVCFGLVTACRLATCPTNRSPSLVNATTEGVVRPPSALGITTGSPPSITATTELVVPRSMPMILEAMSTPNVQSDAAGGRLFAGSPNGGGSHAVDDLRDTPGALASGSRHILHPWGFHPRPAGHRGDHGCDAADP